MEGNELNNKKDRFANDEKTTQVRPSAVRVVFVFLRSRLAGAARAAVFAIFGEGPRAERVWKFLAEWSAVVFLAALAAAIAGALLVASATGRADSLLAGLGVKKTPPAAEAPAAKPVIRRTVDGVPVASSAATDPRLAAVAIDNMVDAWPQSGLAKASLVIEAPVEASITRLLAFFVLSPDVKAEKIGPVRSARPYFIDWAREYDAIYAHVGGSPEALQKIAATDVRDLNEYSGGRFFWRDHARLAPHNAYTSTDLLDKAWTAFESAKPARALGSWKYEDAPLLADRPTEAQKIEVLYQNPLYRAGWTYDREHDDYVRAEDGSEQRIAEDGQVLRAANVVIQYTKVAVLDDVGRRQIDTVGSGDAVVFRGGRAIKGAWSQDEVTKRIKFLDPNGREISLRPGPTWIEVVPTGTEVKY